MRRIMTGSARLFGNAICWSIIFVAVVLVLLSIAIRGLVKYEDSFEIWLTENFGIPLTFSVERAIWRGTQPEFLVADVVLGEGESALKVDSVSAKPDLFRSLVNRSPSWEQLSLDGVDLTLVEQEAGRWQIAGVDLVSEGSGGQASVLERMLLGSRRISLENISLRMKFSSGTEFALKMDAAEVENSFGFHRFAAHAELNQDINQFDFVAELVGVSNRFSELEGLAYASFEGRDLSEIFSALIERYTDTKADFKSNPTITGEFWANIGVGTRAEFQGAFEVDHMPGVVIAPDLDDLYFRSEIAGGYSYFDDDLIVDFIAPDIVISDRGWPLSDFRIQRRPGESSSYYNLQLESVDLAALSNRLGDLSMLPSELNSVVDQLSPAGYIENLEIGLESKVPLESLRITCDLAGVDIGSYQNAPALQNASGKLKATAKAGWIEVDSKDVSVWYPSLYDWWLDHRSATGQVGWQLGENDKLYVYGFDLMVEAEQGLVRGDFLLDGSTKANPEGLDFYLSAGLLESEAKHWHTLVPSKAPKDLLTWLDEADLVGSVPMGGLIYRGKVRKGLEHLRTIQIGLNAQDASARFEKSWPKVERADADISISDTLIRVTSQNAELSGISLTQAEVEVDATPGAVYLSVSGKGQGNSNDLLDLVRQTGLREKVGGSLDMLQFEGDTEASLSLGLPIKKSLQLDDVDIDLTASMEGNELNMVGQDLTFSDLEGRFQYNENGLSGDNVKAVLWNRPLDVTIRENRDAGLIDFSAFGQVEIDALKRWKNIPLLDRMYGETRVDALIQINTLPDSEKPNQYLFTSNLVGVTSMLPGSLEKSSETATELSFLMENFRGNNLQSIQLDLSSGLRLGLRKPLDGSLPEDEFSSAVLSLNTQTPEHEQGFFRGRLHQSDASVEKWLEAILPKQDTSETQEGRILGLRPSIEISAKNIDFWGDEIGSANVVVSSDQFGWLIDFENAFSNGGYVHFYDEGKTPLVRFDQLDVDGYLGIREAQQSQDYDTASVDPRTLPKLDITIDRLILNEAEKGSWSATLEPESDGLRIVDIGCSYFSVKCGDETQRSSLFWGYANGDEYSELSLTLGYEDIADLFAIAGIPAPMDSSSGDFYAFLNWSAAPQKVLETPLSGVMGVTVEDGEFYGQAAGVGAGVIKLVGLVNVDTWLRRLKLDFSDMASGGTAFDNLSGDFTINDNLLSTLSPVVVELPSGRMLIDGNVGLDDNSVDARLVVTLPARQNMTWIAALVGGLPIALPVWFVGKIFDDELDSLASVSYSVTGMLEDPTIKTERVFDATVEE